MAQHQQSLASSQAEMIGSAVCFQTDMQYWNTVARREMVDIASDSKIRYPPWLRRSVNGRSRPGRPQDLLMAEVKLNEAEYQLLQAPKQFRNRTDGPQLHHRGRIATGYSYRLLYSGSSLQDSLLYQRSSIDPRTKIAYDKINRGKYPEIAK